MLFRSQKELLKLSRIAIIESHEPALAALQQAIQTEHGIAEIKDSNFFGLQIKHAYIITSRRESVDEVQPSGGTVTPHTLKALSERNKSQ